MRTPVWTKLFILLFLLSLSLSLYLVTEDRLGSTSPSHSPSAFPFLRVHVFFSLSLFQTRDSVFVSPFASARTFFVESPSPFAFPVRSPVASPFFHRTFSRSFSLADASGRRSAFCSQLP